MSARAWLFVLAASVALLPAAGYAQVQWQPSAPPVVTAENESWFQSGQPIIWNGDYYYPAGARQFFDRYQMIRSGSFRGIPLYTDATREPFSIVFVPLSGGLLQPYERRRSGALAGTTGMTVPSFPTDIAAEGIPTGSGGVVVDIAQNPGPAARARAYDVSPVEPGGTTGTSGTTGTRTPGPTGTSGTIGTSGTRTPGTTGTKGTIGTTTPIRRASKEEIWVEYQGRRWYARGVQIAPRPGEFVERGTYHGFPVYAHPDDPSTIYIPPVRGGLLTPFRLKPEARSPRPPAHSPKPRG